MLNEGDPLVRFKLDILRRAMPARDAVVFGDMYMVEGGFTKKCLDYGCERALLIDTLETPNWLDQRRAHPTLDFYKGDFSDALFMNSISETYEIGVAFEVLLHQPPLLHTLHLMLRCVETTFLVVQPILKEAEVPNTLVYLPGNPDTGLHPLGEETREYQLFDVAQVNHSHWIWAMTASFTRAALAGEGFEITYEEAFREMPNSRWLVWGCVAERRRAPESSHWSAHSKTRDLYMPSGWPEGGEEDGSRSSASVFGRVRDAARRRRR